MDMKTSKRIPPGTPKYHRLTSENRIIIWTLKKEGKSSAYIAKRIGCHRSTIYRELERNRSKKGYRAKKAQKKAEYRVREKEEDRRKLTAAMWSDAMAKVDMGWTFEQISGRAKRDGEATVCKETFYKEYYRLQELVRKGKSDVALPLLPKRQKKRKTRDRNAKKYRNAGRGQIPRRVDIDERLKTVENRARIGNYMLHDRPLKCLNWRTPREAFTDLLKRYLLRLAA